jgi:hypothetical protein
MSSVGTTHYIVFLAPKWVIPTELIKIWIIKRRNKFRRYNIGRAYGSTIKLYNPTNLTRLTFKVSDTLA